MLIKMGERRLMYKRKYPPLKRTRAQRRWEMRMIPLKQTEEVY